MSWARHEFERVSVFSAQVSNEIGQVVVEQRRDEAARAQEEKEGFNRPYTEGGLRRKDVPGLVFGVVAGLRHCGEGAVDGFAEDGCALVFSDAVNKGITTSTQWAERGIRLGVSLGDLIDRRAGEKSKESLLAAMGALCGNYKTQTWRWRKHEFHEINQFCGDVLHVVGGHDRAHIRPGEVVSLLCMQRFCRVPGMCYYSVAASEKWVLAFVDTHEISMASASVEVRTRARDKLEELRRQSDRDFSSDCGAMSEEQLSWLRSEIESCRAAGKHMVVLSNSPLCPRLADRGRRELCVWNWEEVSEALHSAPGVVTLCLSGQQPRSHRATSVGRNRNRGLVEHISIGSSIMSPKGEAPFAQVELFDERISLTGYGNSVASCTVACTEIQPKLL